MYEFTFNLAHHFYSVQTIIAQSVQWWPTSVQWWPTQTGQSSVRS